MQKALILAMNKVPVPFSPSNFRPIALLCFLSKILEKLARNQIVSYLVANKNLDPLQVGYVCKYGYVCVGTSDLYFTVDI